MRKVSLQGAPMGAPPQQIEWLATAVRSIAAASQDSDITDIGRNYSLPTFTVLRTMPASPTTTDLRDVICTLITDLTRGGSTRTG